MKQEYYTLPLALDGIMRKQKHARCTLHTSVAQHLRLLLTTAFGELEGAAGFGCIIWNYDFDNALSNFKLKEAIRESIQASVAEHEQRLRSAQIEISVLQEEITGAAGSSDLKKRIDISITGVLKMTAEKFAYKEAFFIGPLSY